MWADFAVQADEEGWPPGRFLSVLAEHELAERALRRRERHMAEANLPAGKTLDSFTCEAVPMIPNVQGVAVCAGDRWLE